MPTPPPPRPPSNEAATGYDWGSAGKRGAIASRSNAHEPRQCPKCLRSFCLAGIGSHIARCNGLPSPPPLAGTGLNICRCSRLKAAFAEYCFKCEMAAADRESRVEFAILTLLIDARITVSRDELAEEGVPVDNPVELAAWIRDRQRAEEGAA